MLTVNTAIECLDRRMRNIRSDLDSMEARRTRDHNRHCSHAHHVSDRSRHQQHTITINNRVLGEPDRLPDPVRNEAAPPDRTRVSHRTGHRSGARCNRHPMAGGCDYGLSDADPPSPDARDLGYEWDVVSDFPYSAHEDRRRRRGGGS